MTSKFIDGLLDYIADEIDSYEELYQQASVDLRNYSQGTNQYNVLTAIKRVSETRIDFYNRLLEVIHELREKYKGE